MSTIREVVARRTDLSTFVVHLSREYEGTPAATNLRLILAQRTIQARRPLGNAIKRLQVRGADNPNNLDTQKVVCFTETPLEHLHLLLEELEDVDRICDFEPYGVAIPKKMARYHGVNPVWYVDITPSPHGHQWLTTPLNELIDEAIDAGGFAASHIAKLAPFVEQMGTRPNHYRKEFWWEREWRHRGDFDLPGRVIVLAPEDEHADLDGVVERVGLSASFIDPRWGLEQIIASLAGFEPDDYGVF